MCGVIKNVEEPGRALYNGMATLDASGGARVPLPPWFSPKRHSSDSFSYQLTPVGASVWS
jgi:hypothetical protein